MNRCPCCCMQPFGKTLNPFFLLLYYPYIPRNYTWVGWWWKKFFISFGRVLSWCWNWTHIRQFIHDSFVFLDSMIWFSLISALIVFQIWSSINELNIEKQWKNIVRFVKMILHILLLMLLQLSFIPSVKTDIVEIIDYQQQALQNVLTQSKGN